MSHVLIDDPQAIASGGDDEALVNLAERTQIGERVQTLRSQRLRIWKQRPMWATNFK